jgi:FkbM family methyltransferase
MPILASSPWLPHPLLVYKNIYTHSMSAEATIQEHIKAGSALAVFGAGNLGKKIVDFLLLQHGHLVCIADNNDKKWGTTYKGIPITSVKDAINNNPQLIWLVAVWSPNCSYVQIRNQLKAAGATDPIFHSAVLMRAYPDALLPHYLFETAGYYQQHQQKIQQVMQLLEDAESQQQYQSQINARTGLDFDGLPQPDVHNQYFPNGLIHLSEQEYFLDAGAYTGDTFADFSARTNNRYAGYIALEPDPANFATLNQLIQNSPNPSAMAYPYAIANNNDTLSFEATGGAGAVFSGSGNITVDCKRIDDFFADTPFSFIKMDIEGAELDALKGAANTIRRYQPTLAICIYHKPDDIWEIPLYIHQQFPFYSLYARTHQYDGLDFVLYAIKKNNS